MNFYASSYFGIPRHCIFRSHVLQIFHFKFRDSKNVVDRSTLVLRTVIRIQKDYSIRTLRTSHPISKPSSMPLILLPLRSNCSNDGRLWSSAVENMGFRLSPSRLSASANLVMLPRTPARRRSGRRRRQLWEKSNSFNGRPYDEKIYKREFN